MILLASLTWNYFSNKIHFLSFWLRMQKTMIYTFHTAEIVYSNISIDLVRLRSLSYIICSHYYFLCMSFSVKAGVREKGDCSFQFWGYRGWRNGFLTKSRLHWRFVFGFWIKLFIYHVLITCIAIQWNYSKTCRSSAWDLQSYLNRNKKFAITNNSGNGILPHRKFQLESNLWPNEQRQIVKKLQNNRLGEHHHQR